MDKNIPGPTLPGCLSDVEFSLVKFFTLERMTSSGPKVFLQQSVGDLADLYKLEKIDACTRDSAPKIRCWQEILFVSQLPISQRFAYPTHIFPDDPQSPCRCPINSDKSFVNGLKCFKACLVYLLFYLIEELSIFWFFPWVKNSMPKLLEGISPTHRGDLNSATIRGSYWEGFNCS